MNHWYESNIFRGSTSSAYGVFTTDGIPLSSKPAGMNRYGACWNRLTFIRVRVLPPRTTNACAPDPSSAASAQRPDHRNPAAVHRRRSTAGGAVPGAGTVTCAGVVLRAAVSATTLLSGGSGRG